MEEGNRRIVSNERLELVKAYERESSFRGRALAADTLWQSLAPHVRHEICQSRGHHCGGWLQDTLGPSDEKAGRLALTSTARYNLKLLLIKEAGTQRRPGHNVDLVWSALDKGEIQPSQVSLLLERAEDSQSRGLGWQESLLKAKELALVGRRKPSASAAEPAQKPAEQPPPKFKPKNTRQPVRISVDKTLVFQQLKKIVEGAPLARDLPLPDGVDAETYREAFGEMLENVRVVLELASRDFSNAKRRFRTTEITLKVGTLAKACRTLRVTVPDPGQPVDEFASRRRWLEIVKAYHPDKCGGDESKVQIFDAANKAFENIKEYNRTLTKARSEEAR